MNTITTIVERESLKIALNDIMALAHRADLGDLDRQQLNRHGALLLVAIERGEEAFVAQLPAAVFL